MNREQMIEKAARLIDKPFRSDRHRDAAKIVDALLPQVTTVEELSALPFDTKVVDARGEVWARYYLATSGMRPLRWRNSRGGYGKTSLYLAQKFAPFTVVWQP